eukprot:jgi/Tetstr1/420710/TSEL_011793.t1
MAALTGANPHPVDAEACLKLLMVPQDCWDRIPSDIADIFSVCRATAPAHRLASIFGQIQFFGLAVQGTAPHVHGLHACRGGGRRWRVWRALSRHSHVLTDGPVLVAGSSKWAAYPAVATSDTAGAAMYSNGQSAALGAFADSTRTSYDYSWNA